MKYKIYQVKGSDSDNYPTNRYEKPVHQLQTTKLILLDFKDRENSFESIEDATNFITGNDEFNSFSELTILPSLKSR